MDTGHSNDNTALKARIEDLLTRKRKSLEKELAPAIPELNQFIEDELTRLERYHQRPEKAESDIPTMLNQVFHSLLL